MSILFVFFNTICNFLSKIPNISFVLRLSRSLNQTKEIATSHLLYTFYLYIFIYFLTTKNFLCFQSIYFIITLLI